MLIVNGTVHPIDAPDIQAFFKVFRQALDEYGVAVPVRYDS